MGKDKKTLVSYSGGRERKSRGSRRKVENEGQRKTTGGGEGKVAKGGSEKKPQAISVMEWRSRMSALNEVIRLFDGEGDVMAWLMKVKLVAELQHITELEKLILLYLEEDALALNLEMNERLNGSQGD